MTLFRARVLLRARQGAQLVRSVRRRLHLRARQGADRVQALQGVCICEHDNDIVMEVRARAPKCVLRLHRHTLHHRTGGTRVYYYLGRVPGCSIGYDL